MADLLFALGYLVIPIAVFLLVRSLTWALAATGAALAIGGAVVNFGIERGHLWNLAQLRWLALTALGATLVVAAVMTRRRRGWQPTTMGRQTFAVLIPVVAGLTMVIVSRVLAAPSAGLYTAVGFLVQRSHAEDNAKWLDFTGQLVTGQAVDQGVPLGGPLQLVLVMVATALAAVSWILLGGVNEVFVASNTVIYAEFGIAAISGLVLAPLAEQAFGRQQHRRLLPSPLVWTGIAIIGIGSLAASGLGHLTLQFVMMTTAFWIAVFLAKSTVPGARTLASVAVVGSLLVWFPLVPVALVVLAVGAINALVGLARQRSSESLVGALLWLTMAVLAGETLLSSVRYMSDSAVNAASVGSGGGGGGVQAAVHAVVLPALDLLYSQGGTEQVAPILAMLTVVSAVLAVRFVTDGDARLRMREAVDRLGPLLLLAAYAMALSVIGTWWAGAGPNYGALKTTYLVTMVILAVTLPLALAQLDPLASRVSLVQLAAIAAVIYLLAVDGLLPRAVTYLSPKQWPSNASEEKGYWWPAEVRWEASQPISSLPIACAYLPDSTQAPTALPDGQKVYACTRLLSGLSGADSTGLPLVNWLRREWFTNERAWDNEYPSLTQMPESVRAKNFILLDEANQVIGLESVQSYLTRFRPPWAQ